MSKLVPIVKMKSFRTYDTAEGVLKAVRALWKNPKRHTKHELYDTGDVKTATKACAVGAFLLFSDRRRLNAYFNATNMLQSALGNERRFIDVNNGPDGRRELLRAIDKALQS